MHTFLFRRTQARFGHRFRGGDVLRLTVHGRRSGQAFTIPLLHIRDGRDYIARRPRTICHADHRSSEGSCGTNTAWTFSSQGTLAWTVGWQWTESARVK
ncbi:nitroreductase/quinone reductase family protein [Nonomuraea sp. NBC_00507]|uniref:nitroreductase/quinone reductase family protein n=1 Tax=Nonomuraea sp. NBC_00507 TaxID=2976002 RepID=UPI003FA529AF